jgi:uncharacterized protein (DUF1330 family)
MNEIDAGALDGFLAEAEGPVVMLNLLRFQPDGGRERYQQYIAKLGEGVRQRYGLEVLYMGDGGRALIAEEGQSWDAVALVRYPNRAAFVSMSRDPEYREAAHLRAAALVESVLQPTIPVR